VSVHESLKMHRHEGRGVSWEKLGDSEDGTTFDLRCSYCGDIWREPITKEIRELRSMLVGRVSQFIFDNL